MPEPLASRAEVTRPPPSSENDTDAAPCVPARRAPPDIACGAQDARRPCRCSWPILSERPRPTPLAALLGAAAARCFFCAAFLSVGASMRLRSGALLHWPAPAVRGCSAFRRLRPARELRRPRFRVVCSCGFSGSTAWASAGRAPAASPPAPSPAPRPEPPAASPWRRATARSPVLLGACSSDGGTSCASCSPGVGASAGGRGGAEHDLDASSTSMPMLAIGLGWCQNIASSAPVQRQRSATKPTRRRQPSRMFAATARAARRRRPTAAGTARRAPVAARTRKRNDVAEIGRFGLRRLVTARDQDDAVEVGGAALPLAWRRRRLAAETASPSLRFLKNVVPETHLQRTLERDAGAR